MRGELYEYNTNNIGIKELYDRVRLELDADSRMEQALYVEIAKLVADATDAATSSNEGYCFRFSLPLIPVNNLPKLMGITKEEIYNSFKRDWGSDAMKNHMYRDPYYQILLFITYYGLMENKPHIYESAFLVVLFKVWNGRRTKYLKYCNKRIMNYVISNMCTKRHLFVKYDGPLDMLKNHFMPTLLSKYGNDVKRNVAKLQTLFSQAWVRLNQQWISNMRIDPRSGAKLAQGGLLPMYIKAKEQGLTLSTSEPITFDEDTPGFDKFTTTSNRSEIISGVADFITMNPNPKYSAVFISKVNDYTKVSTKVIENVLIGMHSHEYYNLIHDILSMVLSVTNVTDKSDICVPEYEDIVKKKVISSKNNENAKRIQILLEDLLGLIFQKHLNTSFRKYSNVQQIQLRAVIMYGIVYNMRRRVCRTIF